MDRARAVPLVAATLLLGAVEVCAQKLSDGEQIGRVLGWLPDDTETIVVAQQSFVAEDLDPEVEYDGATEARAYILGLLSIADNGKLIESLYGRKVRFAVLAGRRFTTHPEGFLGLIAYQGCAAYVFGSPVGEVVFSRAADTTLLGHEVWVSTGKQYGTKRGSKLPDDTFLRTVLDPDTLLVCNDRDFFSTVLSRATGPSRPNKFEKLPEWNHVDRSAPVWGLRHFDSMTARSDPTSPVNTSLLDAPDTRAIGVTIQVGSPAGKILGRWLTKSTKNPWKTLPNSDDFYGAATVRRASDGVFELLIDDRPRAANFAVYVLMAMLGFAIAL